MKSLPPTLRLQFHPSFFPIPNIQFRELPWRPPQPSVANPRVVLRPGPSTCTLCRYPQATRGPSKEAPADDERSRAVVVGLASLGVVMLLMMGVDEHRALAFGPEGPLVEEFWDNVRRYALYALTVSTGALYTVLQPVLELLKNPITAILILLIIAGSFYVLSQVLSAMVGVTEFSYDYGY